LVSIVIVVSFDIFITMKIFLIFSLCLSLSNAQLFGNLFGGGLFGGGQTPQQTTQPTQNNVGRQDGLGSIFGFFPAIFGQAMNTVGDGIGLIGSTGGQMANYALDQTNKWASTGG